MINNTYRKIPKYYKTMYLDNFTPQEIYSAFKQNMRDQIQSRQSETAEDYNLDIHSTVEIKK